MMLKWPSSGTTRSFAPGTIAAVWCACATGQIESLLAVQHRDGAADLADVEAAPARAVGEPIVDVGLHAVREHLREGLQHSRS